ncbi:NADP-dependent phosphogluconate dehydrogenase [Aetokthonos hydrillicola Thurmond2011]|jgi:6-phosphogluconate dehydrogenase|uniref:6-phosphogluconate dehydrogenase, decarboxylating n=1 Tax=Aetokthonos hydrillicola Thurmond2011 TaxID=2712845 RepID=A0AAP5MBA6_9CYAN|nr:NADP-dependent phosphogluconate dehydrogenase [Aetokthonos hydrillicola]MBO3461582.1 NADP-dependent phosphogluconate dehydrogenase [Aetokthonos hydrillicola CCALA 1050]MBW4586116.1 NADP-dependent phosphogluconate dehydrogenase [Aetokthonos hydrillicola CCALA 1050]MDR9897722.1 NADP-dependent phosphogluconate dehydrogenase [Aetokthonos hydrillicola Thurmond2011]
MSQQQFGLIGLAVMGENLALNVEHQGFSVAVYNRTTEKTDKFMSERAKDKKIQATYSPKELVNSLERPRKILMMVRAGKAVDAVISQLKPLLEPGDILIDGGNSFYEDTARRSQELKSANLEFIGMGVSGGEEGALKGPSLMPGGSEFAYETLEPILTKIAAQVEDGPCVTYLGSGGAGHYVKMVHNGIEYGNMQLIAEAYDVLNHGLGLDNEQLHSCFSAWNATEELNSYLMEITANIFQYIDPESNTPLVDNILDVAEQKGTGRWTVMGALELGVPVPTISAAVNARTMSAFKKERSIVAQALCSTIKKYQVDIQSFIDKLRDALYCAQICSYAEGMELLRAASQVHDYKLNLSEVARIWKGGCIIRAKCLDDIQDAFRQKPDLQNLLLARNFKEAILNKLPVWREVIATAVALDIPIPAFSASLAYFNTYRRDRLPQNLIQAQRDYFGSHTYERIDKPGVFHTEWNLVEEQSLQTGTTD